MFIGIGTAVNVVAVLCGAGIGILLGSRFPEQVRQTVMIVLGLFTGLLGADAASVALTSTELPAAVGQRAVLLVVLGVLLLGGVLGALVRLEDRVTGLAEWLRTRVARSTQSDPGGRERFVLGFVSASMLFCIGPLTVLGSLSDGLGQGPDQLLVKSVLDGFASIAMASGLGVGVACAAGSVLVVQGLLTVAGYALGDVLTTAQVDCLTAVGGLMLLALSIRLMDLKEVPVANLLPALVLAPVAVAVMA